MFLRLCSLGLLIHGEPRESGGRPLSSLRDLFPSDPAQCAISAIFYSLHAYRSLCQIQCRVVPIIADCALNIKQKLYTANKVCFSNIFGKKRAKAPRQSAPSKRPSGSGALGMRARQKWVDQTAASAVCPLSRLLPWPVYASFCMMHKYFSCSGAEFSAILRQLDRALPRSTMHCGKVRLRAVYSICFDQPSGVAPIAGKPGAVSEPCRAEPGRTGENPLLESANSGRDLVSPLGCKFNQNNTAPGCFRGGITTSERFIYAVFAEII